jgi:methanogenic corrinoid protein MtbC1
LGINVPAEQFVRKVREQSPDMLGLSALLTTTMPEMKKIIQALSAGGLRSKVKIMVGGAPVNQRFAREIGADGYGHDAAAAVDLARSFMIAR